MRVCKIYNCQKYIDGHLGQQEFAISCMPPETKASAQFALVYSEMLKKEQK
jgi:hypothetical protein